MLDKKFIDKKYLLDTLRNFDKEILSKQYNSINVSKGEPGENGITPHIGYNGNWFIGDVDTKVSACGKDGKSISEITLDENNNLTVTFSDGSTQNIGSLSINVESNFLTAEGFGNLRYYQGKLEYFDGSNWIETSVTPSNVYIFQMTPQPMKHICGVYDVDKNYYKLMFEEPDDTVIDGQVACVVEKVVIRRKLGSDPENENDGIHVITIPRSNFGMYKDNWYVDTAFSPTLNDKWYYKAFPISTTGFVNVHSDNSTDGIIAKDYYLYGFMIDQNESDPNSMVTYLEDNKKFTNSFMDFSADKFNYGSWKDAFFMPRQCMLYTTGTVAYYLNPNDYTLKLDGTPSDISNIEFEGNAMNEWPKIFWKIVDNEDDTGSFYFSNKKLDDDFVYWSNMDSNGDEIPHFYTPLYEGSLVNGRLRSLSGQSPSVNKTRQQEINYAHENNPEGQHIYETDVFCDVNLFKMLCILISKTLDSQEAFGTGNSNSYVNTTNTGIKKTGTMDKKGMFWGDKTSKVGVKVFGREHFFGNIWKSCSGWINDKGVQKVKMTYGRFDNSTSDGYNITGVGYIPIDDATLAGTTGNGYLSMCKFDKHGIIPKQIIGSSTTKYCDGLWFNLLNINYAFIGGHSSHNYYVGIFCCALNGDPSYTGWNLGASLSCKPTLSIQTGGIS